MTPVAFALLCCASAFVASAFTPYSVPSTSGGCRRSGRTRLFGTIRFVGDANARFDTPPIALIDEDDDLETSLTDFFAASASDPVLLGTKENAKGISQCSRMGEEGEKGQLWECRQASVGWFGMTLQPVFVNRIQKDPDNGKVVITIEDARTEVDSGGRLGNTLASAMRRSKFEGRTAISWKDKSSIGEQCYALEGSLKLTLSINLPPFLPLPPGFNSIGSRIVERTCRERLKQNLSDISDAYLQWVAERE